MSKTCIALLYNILCRILFMSVTSSKRDNNKKKLDKKKEIRLYLEKSGLNSSVYK